MHNVVDTLRNKYYTSKMIQESTHSTLQAVLIGYILGALFPIMLILAAGAVFAISAFRLKKTYHYETE